MKNTDKSSNMQGLRKPMSQVTIDGAMVGVPGVSVTIDTNTGQATMQAFGQSYDLEKGLQAVGFAAQDAADKAREIGRTVAETIGLSSPQSTPSGGTTTVEKTTAGATSIEKNRDAQKESARALREGMAQEKAAADRARGQGSASRSLSSGAAAPVAPIGSSEDGSTSTGGYGPAVSTAENVSIGDGVNHSGSGEGLIEVGNAFNTAGGATPGSISDGDIANMAMSGDLASMGHSSGFNGLEGSPGGRGFGDGPAGLALSTNADLASMGHGYGFNGLEGSVDTSGYGRTSGTFGGVNGDLSNAGYGRGEFGGNAFAAAVSRDEANSFNTSGEGDAMVDFGSPGGHSERGVSNASFGGLGFGANANPGGHSEVAGSTQGMTGDGIGRDRTSFGGSPAFGNTLDAHGLMGYGYGVGTSSHGKTSDVTTAAPSVEGGRVGYGSNPGFAAAAASQETADGWGLGYGEGGWGIGDSGNLGSAGDIAGGFGSDAGYGRSSDITGGFGGGFDMSSGSDREASRGSAFGGIGSDFGTGEYGGNAFDTSGREASIGSAFDGIGDVTHGKESDWGGAVEAARSASFGNAFDADVGTREREKEASFGDFGVSLGFDYGAGWGQSPGFGMDYGGWDSDHGISGWGGVDSW